MVLGGVVLRLLSFTTRILQFLDAAVILGIYSYFLAVLAQHNHPIATPLRVVEGLSGAATLYSLLGILFVCCLGGVALFAFLGIVLDVCFAGAMIAIAVLTRRGTQACIGVVTTPVGTGKATAQAPANATFGFVCDLEKVAFAVAIVGVFLFLISILFEILMARHHKREKRFGPSPTNNYTFGSGGKFWRRNRETGPAPDTLPGHPTPADVETVPNQDSWFRWGRKTSAPAAGPTAVENGYGYGSSAYTGNY